MNSKKQMLGKLLVCRFRLFITCSIDDKALFKKCWGWHETNFDHTIIHYYLKV